MYIYIYIYIYININTLFMFRYSDLAKQICMVMIVELAISMYVCVEPDRVRSSD